MRFVFTDGWNSSWHVLFGMMAYYNLFIILLFAYYQFILKYDFNSAIDFAEFLAGYTLMWAFYSTTGPEEKPILAEIQKEDPSVQRLALEISEKATHLSALLNHPTPSGRTRNYTRRAPRPL